MRALFFVNSFAGGGAERVCLNLAKQLYKMNIESDFITVYNKEADYELPDYIHVYPLNIEDKTLACLKLFPAVPRINAWIADKDYVLITSHLQPSHLLTSLTAVRNRSLYVMHSRCRPDEHASWLERICLNVFLRKKKIVTVSEGLKEEFKNEYRINLEDIVTIYNPHGLEKQDEGVKYKSLHTRDYILVMGRITEEKNPLLALELYYRGGFFDRYDLIFLGKGSLEDTLRKQITEYGLQEHVIMAGFQKNPAQWLMNASLLLSSSRQEGLPMNLIEALFYGIPVVAADCPYGPNEILTGELAKYLIYPEDQFEESIATIASALASYPEIMEKYYEKFDNVSIARTYLNVWKSYFGAK